MNSPTCGGAPRPPPSRGGGGHDADPLEATVAGHTARHLTATTSCQPGRCNTDAAQLIESLHTRAQRRAQRRVSVPTRAITPTTARQARNCMSPNNPRSKRRPISPALIRARGSAAAAALAAVLVCTTHTAPAEAAPSSVSPGDRIATPDLCTIGYTYTGTDAHTYALTAGHCASTAPVRDHSTGATGTFVASIVDPPRSGGAGVRPGRLRAPHSRADRHQRPSSRQETHTAAAQPNRLADQESPPASSAAASPQPTAITNT